MCRAMLGTIMATGLVRLAANMQTELASFITGPTAHPCFHIRRRMMKDGFFENDGFRLRLLLQYFGAAL